VEVMLTVNTERCPQLVDVRIFGGMLSPFVGGEVEMVKSFLVEAAVDLADSYACFVVSAGRASDTVGEDLLTRNVHVHTVVNSGRGGASVGLPDEVGDPTRRYGDQKRG
jgi:hypothetical protein